MGFSDGCATRKGGQDVEVRKGVGGVYDKDKEIFPEEKGEAVRTSESLAGAYSIKLGIRFIALIRTMKMRRTRKKIGTSETTMVRQTIRISTVQFHIKTHFRSRV
jgi:hypothetical protein